VFIIELQQKSMQKILESQVVIRNTDDGNVEAFVSGLPEQVQFFLTGVEQGHPVQLSMK
jgi:hypothetical protein